MPHEVQVYAVTDKLPQTVTDLVDGFLLFSVESAIAYSILFKEISNLVSRCQEVFVADVVVVPSGKLRL